MITANVTSCFSTLLGIFAIYVDQDGIDPLLHSNPTYRYCAQSFAATFIFDIVVTIMSLVMFITTFLSLVFPSIFQEIDIKKYRRENEVLDVESKDEKESTVVNAILSNKSIDYTKNNLYERKESIKDQANPQNEYKSRIDQNNNV